MLFFQKNKNFCLKITNASLRRKKKYQELIFAEDPYEPGLSQSILKIFVINDDSMFAKCGKLTTR